MRRKWVRTGSAVIFVLAVILIAAAWSGGSPRMQADVRAYATAGRHPDAAKALPTERGSEYTAYLRNSLASGGPYAGAPIIWKVDGSVEAKGYEYKDGDSEVSGYLQSTDGGDGDGFVRWTVRVPESGLYQISFLYMPQGESRTAPERELRIDGVLPFEEANRVKFPRAFHDEGEVRYDAVGDQIRGKVAERREWRWTSFSHPEGYFTRPYAVFLDEGEHTIALHDVREPLALAGLRLEAPGSPPPYREWRESLRSGTGDAMPAGALVTVEAEDHWSRSNPYIRPNWNRDPLMTPNGVDHVRFNAFGGDRWSLGGQEVVYRFEAPADGWYAITLRLQQTSLNRNSYRKIKIDGEVPFLELERYPFPFNRQWVNHTLAAADGEPFLFYFEAGVHELSLETLTGPNRSTVDAVRSVVDRLGELRREIQKVVSSTKDASGQLVADTERDWDLDLYIPDIRERFQALADELQEQLDYQLSLSGGTRTSETSVLSRAVTEVRRYGERLEYVPLQLNEMGELLTSLASITQTLTEQPLELDKLYIHDPALELPRGTASAWEKAGSAVRQFIASFTNDRNRIASGDFAGEGERRITVSMARGREWAEVLSRMAEEDFTPATGIAIDINLLPLNSEHMILLAYTAGKAPDVAMGITPSVPVEFAVRNSVADLSQFPDFAEVRNRFHEGMLIPYMFDGKYYALPETQDFLMTYYRTDILEELGLAPPKTWEDVYRMLPVLRSGGMDFYFPPGPQSYTFFLYQHGGDFFRNGGAETAIDTPEALAAFEQWTGLYTFHAVQLQADFYQRFRTGEMPVGIAGYDMFVRLMAAAPELYGKWSMDVIPGTERPDGVVDHTSGGVIGNTQAVMIMETAKDKEAAWEFVKWWTSAETQRRYGEEIEALLGAGSRWNSANIEAFAASDWTAEEARSIEEAISWVREQPVVLGSYYVHRQLLNAWNRTVLADEKKPVRIILEDAVDEINKELGRKRKEFGLE